MGYDLHITRKDHWFEESGPTISRDEWRALVASDPELQFDPDNGPDYALWRGASEIPEPWLRWDDGDISTKYPDRALIVKMVAIATRLGATVQGDDGERYDAEGQPERESDRKAGGSCREFVLFWGIVILIAIGMSTLSWWMLDRER